MSSLSSKAGWARAAVATIATVVAAQILFFILTFFVVDPTFGIGAEGFGERAGPWLLPTLTLLLTFLTAAWAAPRGTETAAGGVAGLVVGLLVAIIDLLFYGWFGPAALALFVLTPVAGLLGGLLGSRGSSAAGTRR